MPIGEEKNFLDSEPIADFGELGDFKGKNALIDLLWPTEAEPDLALIETALGHGASPIEPGPWGLDALMLAAGNGDGEILRFLLPVSNPLAADHKGRTALMHAARQGRARCLPPLLAVSDAQARAKNGKMASEMLLEKEDRFSAAIQTAMALHERCPVPRGIWERFVTLAFDNRRSPPEKIEVFLAMAAANSDLNNARVSSTDWGGDTDDLPLLEVVAHRGHTQYAKMLLRFGISPDGPTAESCPLWHAASSNNAELIRALLEAGANPNKCNAKTPTALHALAFAERIKGQPVVEAMAVLAPVSDLAIRDAQGKTALQVAIERQNWSAVEALGRYLSSRALTELPLAVAGALLPELRPRLEAAAEAVALSLDVRAPEVNATDAATKTSVHRRI